MQQILQHFSKGEDFQHVLTAHQKGIQEQLVSGLSGSSKSLFISSFLQEQDHSILVVTHNLFHAQKLYEDLIEWLDEDDIQLYPVNDLISSDIATASPELKGQRIQVLNQLLKGRKSVVIVPLAGVRRFLPPVADWKNASVTLQWGQDLDLEAFQQHLLYLGYERVGMVERQGEYSIRGGILDLYPASEAAPIRIELFDTEIDSIRTFDLSTQRSLETMKQVAIGPTVELLVRPEHFAYAKANIEKALQVQLQKTADQQVQDKLVENIGWELEQLQQNSVFQSLYKYVSCLYPKPSTIIDYLPSKAVVLFDEPARIIESEEYYKKEELDWKMSLVQTGEYLSDLSMAYPFEEWRANLKRPVLHVSLFLRQLAQIQPQNIVNFTSKSMQNFHGQIPIIKGEVSRWQKSRQAVIFLASDEERAKRMVRVLEDFDINVNIHVPDRIQVGVEPLIMIGRLHAGFELPLHQLVVVTESEIFTKQQKKKSRMQKQLSNAERIKNYSELNVGDHVVHINHGIGKYLGIVTLEIDGVHKDYLHLKYSGNDKLYVPVEQIDQVQKYVGGDDHEPKVYSLGGSDWKKVKSKVESSVKDIAADLIKLYAKREATEGFPFAKDSDMHQEFDSLFPYQETEDQLRAIEEIKKDMEKSRPMDRLLCGDVGYGKTEVAIRAAFKAVMDGKQVAILVPTTILAQQHYETMRERFIDYPIGIEVLSRFRSRKEQNQTIKKLKTGLVDIVIGTHRLLSKDLEFKDLGLLIVDEEQRFGVSHKEKIKQLKENIDVLTLTATPIPRTLHMSMLGVRDLSVIETPPENRFPVQTYVVEYNGALVREAIERELSRGGQVYFLFNQVQGIEQMAEQIRMLVPDARVAIAHGQMKESELEGVMIDFLEGEFDVLVSTTIIETGVDIPNVNTLLIYNADKMGLSQLYQLRGRVGRSNRMAYAYFTYQRDKVLTEVAEKRLQAIKEFTELGSGFKIAMRDLSIRGAGNLLGAEQHGFITSVGFDLYSQLLKEAIDELKGEKPQQQKPQLEVDLHVDAYIPETYVKDGKQKIEMYKKVHAVQTLEDVQELEEEFLDRFGHPPEPVARLFIVARLKGYAMKLGMESLILKNDTLKMMFHASQNDKIDGGRLFHIANQYGRRVGLISDRQIGISFKTKGLPEGEWLTLVEQFVTQLDQENILKGEEKHAL
ncbi:transcription-repair coupling factor [Bacillus horti]|uniref:Transcription-repair-coupling factor n=1 Tax=Caldalkalibacillus horti TaxID=77523 RepID=A0ABT9W2W5_9BACI|nr:transcription-repair coupling factor [Bacillus horti]MDQ0167583.1 transcription-repair coupling factor (superfamily II helicase) [Bacillus horti]